jgi:hypothetical protein
MIKIWFSVSMMIILFGCVPKMEPVITGDIASLIVTVNYDKDTIAEITDQETINKIIQKINEGKREDISDIVWERGPDGTMLFKKEEDTVVLRFFSEHSPFDVIWSDAQSRYSIDTNFILDDFSTDY